MNENFIDLDFYHGLPSHSFVDKKAEVRVNIGRVSSVPHKYRHLVEKYGGILLGIQQSGMPADRLDQMCNLLALNCASLPFDSQWYFFGDIEGLLKAAQDELVRPPFTKAMHDNISFAIGRSLR